MVIMRDLFVRPTVFVRLITDRKVEVSEALRDCKTHYLVHEDDARPKPHKWTVVIACGPIA